MRFLFHVGMGKTGTTAIQHALARSEPELAAAGLRYLGMWAPWIGPDHDGSAPFHRFLRLPPDRLAREAERCLAWAEGLAAGGGATRLVHSNESFHAVPFFRRLAALAEVRLVAYLRAPARWLPSAYLQWGIVHKTNPGPVASFAATGRRLMGQYGRIATLRRELGDLLDLRPYPEGGDVLDDFGAVLGVALRPPEARPQQRPGPAETLLRAAFNGGFAEPVLPQAFNAAMRPVKGGGSLPASRRLRELLDLSEMPRIIEENGEMLAWLGGQAGMDLLAEAADPAAGVGDPLPARADLDDALLGALVDLVAHQARETAALKARLAAIESRLPPA